MDDSAAIPPPPPKREGSSVSILRIVVASLIGGAIVLAVVLPQPHSPRGSFERHAAASLKMIRNAEEDFREHDRDGNKEHDYWTRNVHGLYNLKGPDGQMLKAIEPGVAAADRDGGVPDPKAEAGYWFHMIPRGAPDGYATIAYPSDYPKSGKLTFVLTEDATIWSKDTKGVPIGSPPKDFAAEGWTKVD